MFRRGASRLTATGEGCTKSGVLHVSGEEETRSKKTSAFEITAACAFFRRLPVLFAVDGNPLYQVSDVSEIEVAERQSPTKRYSRGVGGCFVR